MFDKLSKTQKRILYFFIIFSCLFVLPIILWIGVFIGYQICKSEMKIGLQTVLDNTQDVDNNYLEIDL